MLPSITKSSFRPFFPSLFDDDFFSSLPASNRMSTHMPAVNIREDEKDYFLELAVPGIDKKDLKIDIDEDVLTISSEHKNESEEKQEGYTRREFSYSSFARSFYIPDNVNKENINANYKDGVLIVSFPKQEDKRKITKEVKIQ
jgi:HSP20 family protein